MNREVISVELTGHNGPHQFGFTRYARVTLDCGHSATEQFLLAGEQNGFRRSTTDETPMVGTTRLRCMACKPENLHRLNPGIRDHREWGRWSRVAGALGLSSEEFNAWAHCSPRMNLVLSRLCGGDGQGIVQTD